MSKSGIAACVLVFGLCAGTPFAHAWPTASPATANACAPDLPPLPVRPQATQELAPGVGLQVWRVRQPAAEGRVPRHTIIAAVRIGSGAAQLHPYSGGIPRLVHPIRPMTRPDVIAAINGDYFEPMKQGDALPRGAVVVNGQPLFMPVGLSSVLAVDEQGHPRATRVSVVSTVLSGSAKIRPRAVNDPMAPAGKAVIFTGDWSRAWVPKGRYSLVIKSGRVVRIVPPEESATVPRGGYVIWTDQPQAVARFPKGTRVDVSLEVEAADGAAVVGASGHGGVYLEAGERLDKCGSQPDAVRPRTTIAWNTSTGDMWLITASTGLPDPPDGVRIGGATKAQMAGIAESLGATDAIALDGGGSTCLYVRSPKGGKRIDLLQEAWARPVPVLWALHESLAVS